MNKVYVLDRQVLDRGGPSYVIIIIKKMTTWGMCGGFSNELPSIS